MQNTYDFIIIGAGIVGASTAMQLKQKYPDKSIVLLEKEENAAQHQTGHNSGVIHAGVYYAPKSLKADFCRRGLTATIKFCEQHDIAYDQCGKLIVATDNSELERLDKLFENCQTNGLQVSWLSREDLREAEPNIVGIKGFLVKDSAITDYPAITQKMLEQFKSLGGEIAFNTQVRGLTESQKSVLVSTASGQEYQTSYLISCAGLQADRIARLIGIKPDFRIIPFKGEYFKLPAARNNIVKHLIYPVPDPDMPFLGVHLTKMIDGSITVGPNAVLSLSRESYKKFGFKRPF